MNDKVEYRVLVWARDDKYFGGIQELGILETSNDLAALWRQIQDRKQELIRKFVDGGIADELPPPLAEKKTFFGSQLLKEEDSRVFAATSNRGSGGEAIRTYVAKTVIAVSGALVCLFVASQYLEAAVYKLTSKRIVVREVIENYAASLETLPEVKRESLHRSLQTIASNMRPFVKDLRPLLNEWSASACSESCGGKPGEVANAPDHKSRR